MARHAFFHIGMPKTGTTAIQDFCAANRQALSQNGLLYPGSLVDHADLLPFFHQRGGAHFYYHQRGISEADALATAQRARDDITRDLTSSAGDALLSSEYFYNIGPARMRQLAAFFTDLGFDFRVIIYIRHPLSAAISHANQDIKMGKRTLAECAETPKWHSNQKSLETLLRALKRDQIIVRDYEAVPRRDCVRDILSVCGYRGALDGLEAPRSNVSLSMAGAILADACHKLRTRAEPMQIDQSFAYNMGGPKFSLPNSALDEVRKGGAAEVRWVKDTFGLDLVEPEPDGVFSDSLDPAAALQLTAYIAALQDQISALQANRDSDGLSRLIPRQLRVR